MAPAQRKKSKKMVNTLKLGILQKLILALKIRTLKLNTVHILQLHSEVPQLLAIWNFTGICHTGAERRNLRSRCKANTSVRISQHHFAFPSFKKSMPSGSLFWCVHLLLGGGSTHSSLTSRGDVPWNSFPPSTFSFTSRKLRFKETAADKKPRLQLQDGPFDIH